MAEVSLKHINKKYPNGFEAVKDFNLDIADGEFVIFVGPSGCGKSTTLRMVAGLEDISGGELIIGGTLMNDVEPKDRDIAMVFQNYALYGHMTIYENIYNSSQTLDGIYSNGLQGYSRRSGIFSYTMNNVNRVNYSNTFGRHSVSALGALELTSKTHRYLYASGYGFINDFIKELAYATSGSISGSSNTTYSKSLSYLAQLTYSFDKRYYLTTSWRRQGNSSFSTYARWGNFASVGLSYNMHNEKWFSIPWISTLKLKASYGNNGNSRLDTSSAYGTYTYSDGSYYGGVMGAHQSTPPNPGLSWETTYIQNYGVSLGITKRVEIDVEYYDKLTDNLLYNGRV